MQAQPDFEIVFEEARIVQQIFGWIGQERCTISEVCRRLQQAGVHTQTGKAYWNHKTIWDMLKNPAYKGEAAFGKTRSGPLDPRLRAPKGRPSQSKRGYSPKNVPPEEWITIAVPALIDAALFEAAQEQLQENKQRARIPEKGTRYLLQGLLLCSQCGYAYCGRTNDARNAYYRCSGSDASRFGGTRLCHNKEVRIDRLDGVVWQEVCQLLEEPHRMEQEYRRRLEPPQEQGEQGGLETQLGKLRRGIARLIDSYAEGLIDKTEFEPRVARMRERVQHLEEQLQHLKKQTEVEEEVRLIWDTFETFSTKVQAGLQNADWQTRRDIIRALVKRVEIDEQQIRVVFRVSPTMVPSSSQHASHNWQHCGRRVHSCGRKAAITSIDCSLSQSSKANRSASDGGKGTSALLNGRLLRSAYWYNDGLFVDIESGATRMDHLHGGSPFFHSMRMRRETEGTNIFTTFLGVLTSREVATISGSGRPPASFFIGLRAPLRGRLLSASLCPEV